MPAKHMLESIPKAIRALRSITVSVLDGPLTFHQTRVLFSIKEGLGQAQIAHAFQISPAAVCKLMHQLEEKDFIRMKPGKDRRHREIELTKEGSKLLSTVSRQVEKILNKSLESLSNDERNDLMRGLDVLDKVIGQIKEG